jgi:L-fuculose-phosphate aldolase
LALTNDAAKAIRSKALGRRQRKLRRGGCHQDGASPAQFKGRVFSRAPDRAAPIPSSIEQPISISRIAAPLAAGASGAFGRDREPMSVTEQELREQMVDVMLKMGARGLNKGTSGNCSVRFGDGLLVTPSGVVPEALTPQSIVHVDQDGGVAPGALAPSSEWRMHKGILDRRPDVRAVVHCHSHYATVLACAHRPIPSVHYMVAVSGGPTIEIAPYHMFGSMELAQAVIETLDGRLACLMANHGQIALGPSLARALSIAEQVEEQAAIYWGALAIGGPKLLDGEQMAAIATAFGRYGQAKR